MMGTKTALLYSGPFFYSVVLSNVIFHTSAANVVLFDFHYPSFSFLIKELIAGWRGIFNTYFYVTLTPVSNRYILNTEFFFQDLIQILFTINHIFSDLFSRSNF